MLCFLSGSNSFGFSRARRNHEIILWKVEKPKCQRPEKHTELVSAIQVWNILNKTGVNFPSFEIFRSIRKKHRRINLRFRVHIHEFHEYPLCTTPMSDPICNQGYFFLRHISIVYRWNKNVKSNQYWNSHSHEFPS